jgi:hypothetical protein
MRAVALFLGRQKGRNDPFSQFTHAYRRPVERPGHETFGRYLSGRVEEKRYGDGHEKGASPLIEDALHFTALPAIPFGTIGYYRLHNIISYRFNTIFLTLST